MCLRKPSRKIKKDASTSNQKQSASNIGSRSVKELLSKRASEGDAGKKRKRQRSGDYGDDGDDEGDEECIVLESDGECVGLDGVKALFQGHQYEEYDDDDDNDDWQTVTQLRPPKRSCASNISRNAVYNDGEVEVLVLSSD
jgi:hypothetical protein